MESLSDIFRIFFLVGVYVCVWASREKKAKNFLFLKTWRRVISKKMRIRQFWKDDTRNVTQNGKKRMKEYETNNIYNVMTARQSMQIYIGYDRV
jgi:hypothetical protein